jgi:alpha-galactosidase
MTVQANPVMGFSTWYAFRTAISESLVLEQAELLVSSGLAAAGYNYFSLDDGWMDSERDASGQLQGDPAKFPSGMAALVGQIHGLGLKFGIYTAIGTRTCQNLPGSWGHYCRDVQTFADWGVDLVKVDECGGLPSGVSYDTITEDFRQFSQCMADSMPDAVYSQELPVFGFGNPAVLAQAINDSATFSNMWRICGDQYPLTHANAYPALLAHLDADIHLHGLARAGRWNDLDMVAPGYGNSAVSTWNLQDLQNQLAVWAMEASPLLISADLTTLPASALAALANPHMIAIAQSGAQCATAVTEAHVQALVKPDPRGGLAVCYVNRGTGAASATFTLAELGITSATATGTDIWSGNPTGPFSSVGLTLPANTARLSQVVPV